MLNILVFIMKLKSTPLSHCIQDRILTKFSLSVYD